MSETNWKSKYQDLKMKFMNAVDTSFRIGYEQGAKEAQAQAQADQAAQAQAQAQQAQQQGMPGEEGEGQEEAQSQGDAPQDGNAPAPGGPPQAGGGSELDQHINTLESMVAKSELSAGDLQEIKKSLDGLKAIQQDKLAKAAIKDIAKALNRPNKVWSPQAKANLNPSAKAAVSMQERVITDVMKSWDEEATRAGKDILSVLASEGIIKKD